jgi:tRNA threonylcarbamoyladenosine biosynthesis protein TsaE
MSNRRLLLRSESPEQMQSWAASWAPTLPRGSVLALHGDLGAGKTTFTAGLVSGLLPSARVSSPTFAYLHLYGDLSLQIAHFDCYRLRSPEDFLLMGWDEILDQAHLTILEWPERCGACIPARALHLEFQHAGPHREIWQIISS